MKHCSLVVYYARLNFQQRRPELRKLPGPVKYVSSSTTGTGSISVENKQREMLNVGETERRQHVVYATVS